jgi:RimJ/RimL family protein N-acetyltransferase
MEPGEAQREQPVLNLIGEKIALGPIRRDLIPLYQRWVNDFEVTRGLIIDPPITAESEEEWYDSVSAGQRAPHFTIYERSTLRPIGNIGMMRINQKHRAGEMGILIGEKDCWGKGYGTEAVSMVLDYGFTVLGLHNMMLTVYGFNERAIRAYKRAGFKVMGHRREAIRIGDLVFDEIFMDCLATEFQGSAVRRAIWGSDKPTVGGDQT